VIKPNETDFGVSPIALLGYAHMGRLEEAREIVERLRAFTTGVLESFSYIRNSGHRELLLSGLRLAMGETT